VYMLLVTYFLPDRDTYTIPDTGGYSIRSLAVSRFSVKHATSYKISITLLQTTGRSTRSG
jgi:hypothetical protein